MIVEFFILAIFTGLFATGLHAVTRDDKLLWFLGARINTHKLKDLQTKKESAINARFDIYSDAIEDIELGDEEPNIKLRLQKDQERSYNADVEKIEDVWDFGILEEERKINSKKKKLHIRLMLALAPALTECLTCMSSIWSIVTFSLHYTGILYKTFFGFPIIALFFVFAVAGINSLAAKIIQ